MMPPARNQLWRKCRWLPHWFLGIFVLLLLILAGIFAYLNLVGVPEFVKVQLENELRQRGVNVKLGTVRLAGLRKLVAEDVALSQQTNQQGGPELSVEKTEIHLDRRALRSFAFRVDALILQNASVVWPLQGPAQAPEQFAVEKISGELQFLDNDRWYLSRLDGTCSNINFHVSGVVTNASVFRPLTRPPADAARGGINWPEIMAKVSRRIADLGLEQTVDLSLYLSGDARHPLTFTAKLQLDLPEANTASAQIRGLKLDGNIVPSPENPDFLKAVLQIASERVDFSGTKIEQPRVHAEAFFSLTNQILDHAEWKLQSQEVQGRWGAIAPLDCSGSTVRRADSSSPYASKILVNLNNADTAIGRAQAAELRAEFTHALTNFQTFSGTAALVAKELKSRWGSLDELDFKAQLQRADIPEGEAQADASWAYWSTIEPYRASWEANLNRLSSPEIEVETLNIAGAWKAPEISITKLNASLYRGHLDAQAHLNVANRRLESRADFNFDVQQITGFLTTNAVRWIRQFTWEEPPHVIAQAGLTMPPWTASEPDWREEVLPTVTLAGEFTGGAGSFRKVPVTAARSHFTLTNFFWRLPDLTAIRPEGEVLLDYHWNMDNQDFYWVIDSKIDPMVLRPLLDPPEQKAMDFVKFTEPPRLRGEIWGRWMDRDRIGFKLNVAATNLMVRGQQCDEIQARVSYTNLFLNFSDVRAIRGTEKITAPSLGFDPVNHQLYVTNAVSTMDPNVVTRIAGPNIYAIMEPYQFHQPPTIRLNGIIPTAPKAHADAHFEIAGRDFHYWKFNAPYITGDVFWKDEQFSVTNVQASFYGGQLAWHGEFDASVPDGSDFKFHGRMANSDLNLLMKDLAGGTNRFEGIVNGELTVTHANSSDWKSWNGHGSATLQDGFLWNIPVFGFFSPMLDRIVPGLGSSRVKSGSATFTMERSVLHTSDLELRSSPVRLQYTGTVDFEGNIDARMQAELLRDAWAIGRVVSFALWPITKVFEYKITGTLSHPKSEPLYIPEFLFWPLRPFRAFRDLLLEERPHHAPPAAEGKSD